MIIFSPNRTVVELKYYTFWMVDIRYNTPNRTVVELKFFLFNPLTTAKISQSYRGGIEM